MKDTPEFPAMLYKRDGTMLQWDGKMFDTLVVADEEELEIALSDGWDLPWTLANPLDHDGDGKSGGARKPKAAK